MLRWNLILPSWVGWAAVVAATAGVLVLVIWWPLVQPVLPALPAGAVSRIEAAAKVLTPLAVLFGLAVAWKRASAADKQAHLAEQGQVTERFTRAMEMLGDDKDRLPVKLGGIYALERVAKDSPKDRWTVLEVLCSYVQANRPIIKIAEGEEAPPDPVPKDIQAILTVLGRRDRSPFRDRLDLSRANLRGANLERASLHWANLEDANLEDANLQGAKLWGAKLEGANLERANLISASLTNAYLEGANLKDAKLKGAALGGARLIGANLTGTILDPAKTPD